MPVRLKDIAAELNLSVVTVSKALRGYDDIATETRERVLAKVRELNYQPNLAARSLVTRRSYAIGMVMPHLRHTFFQEAYEAIARQASPKGYTVLMAISLEDPAAEQREVEQLLARQVDGLIVASALPCSSPGYLKELVDGDVPVVLLDRSFEGLESHFVGVDDERLAGLAVDHLVAQGRRRIAHIRGPEASTAATRFEGYKAGLERAGLKFSEDLVAGGRGDDETGYQAVLRMLAAENRPDGVFCYNDPQAAGAMRAALESGLRVPEDLAIVGAGNMHYSDLFRVPLSTVDQDSRECGARAGALMLDLIESENRLKPKRILVAPRLVVRRSSHAGV